MADVVRWLEDLGPGEYAQAFAENDADGETLLHLTSEDLRVFPSQRGPK